jgi:GrpB-like predicted nucleotidyltransferase (UPF0157 family)/uncharacterized protein (DUF952 family)
MNEVLIGGIEKRKIVVVDYDAGWPDKFRKHADILSGALGDKALAIEHVGSTSVQGLAAKPVIDIDVLVADSGEESTYLPALVEAGYVLRVREPDWHQHRMFRTPELDVHVHIFSPECVEVARHRAFRDRLRICAEDRLLYESVKRKLSAEDWPDMNAYAQAKTEVVEQILARALPEDGSPTVAVIYHITTQQQAADAQASGQYTPIAFGRDGFIHCSYVSQIPGVANANFHGQRDLVLLEIRRESLTCRVTDENLEGGHELFPHIYGVLPWSTVMAVVQFPLQEDGVFKFPTGVEPSAPENGASPRR